MIAKAKTHIAKATSINDILSFQSCSFFIYASYSFPMYKNNIQNNISKIICCASMLIKLWYYKKAHPCAYPS